MRVADERKCMTGLRLVGRGLHDTFENLAYFCIATLLWWVAQFTIVLGPPATIALYTHTDPRHGTVTDRPTLAETARAAISNFWPAWKLVLIQLPFIALFVYNVGYYGASTSAI